MIRKYISFNAFFNNLYESNLKFRFWRQKYVEISNHPWWNDTLRKMVIKKGAYEKNKKN